MVRYINTVLFGVKETLDELTLEDFKSYWEFKRELKRLVHEYAISGHGCPYISQRACK